MKAQLHAFVTPASVIIEGQWLISRPIRFNPEDRIKIPIEWEISWARKPVLRLWQRRKSSLNRESNTDRPTNVFVCSCTLSANIYRQVFFLSKFLAHLKAYLLASSWWYRSWLTAALLLVITGTRSPLLYLAFSYTKSRTFSFSSSICFIFLHPAFTIYNQLFCYSTITT